MSESKNLFFKKTALSEEYPSQTGSYTTDAGYLNYDLTTKTFNSPKNGEYNLTVSFWMKPMINFDDVVEPAIKFLFKNHHPHTSIHISYDRAELMEGIKSTNFSEEVPD